MGKRIDYKQTPEVSIYDSRGLLVLISVVNSRSNEPIAGSV